MKKIALDVEYDPKRDLWMISSPHIDKRKIKEVFVVPVGDRSDRTYGESGIGPEVNYMSSFSICG
jgi:hypothetical protein